MPSWMHWDWGNFAGGVEFGMNFGIGGDYGYRHDVSFYTGAAVGEGSWFVGVGEAHAYALLATDTLLDGGKLVSSAIDREFTTVTEQKSIVIGEGMSDRVIPVADKMKAEYYQPVEAPESKWMENNRLWINEKMDQNYKIFDIGAEPGRTMYPKPTSDYYRMELNEIGIRDYENYEQIESDY